MNISLEVATDYTRTLFFKISVKDFQQSFKI